MTSLFLPSAQVQSWLVLVVISGVFTQEQEFKERNDLAILQAQKKTLDEFKKLVSPILPHRYMKEDIYLIRFLRANNFDLKAADQNLRENLRWRKENKVDAIHLEDFGNIRKKFPVHIDTLDKRGQPVITAVARQSEIREFVTGRNKTLYRYAIKILDEAALKVREAQLAGQQVTRFNYLLNLHGHNIVQPGCPLCTLELIEIMRLFEKYFPEMIDKFIIVNAPPTLRNLMEPLVHNSLSGNTIGSVNVKIFGSNREEWKKFLFEHIDESQLPLAFGGKRVRV